MSRSIWSAGCYHLEFVVALQEVDHIWAAHLPLEDVSVDAVDQALVVRKAAMHVQVRIGTLKHLK